MPPKKKKTQLKPVARGFTTTSVPKKVAEESKDASQPEPTPTCDSVTSPSQACGEQARLQPSATAAPPQDGFDADQVEVQSLQNLVDKYQEKTERDVSKKIKVVEVDRRYSKTFLPLPVDPILVERVLELYVEEEAREARKSLDEPEERAAARLAVTYGVLRRLGFPEGKVEQCLRAIPGVELDEAYEWLYVHCSDDELEEYGVAGEPQTKKVPQNKTTRDTEAQPGNTAVTRPVQASPTPEAGAHSAAPSPSPALTDKHPVQSSAPTDTENDYSSSASPRSSPEPQDPNAVYARIKMQIVNLRTKSADKIGELPHLEKRLREVKAHYFFTERTAESLFRVEREKADVQLLQAKLRGTLSPPRAKTVHTKTASPAPIKTPEPDTESDFFNEDDVPSGGMLELLEAMPNEVQGVGGTTIRVRDMPFSAKSAKVPRVALVEQVSRTDRLASVTFRSISGPSKAKRASIRITWQGKEVSEWVMEDVACYDELQAEQYIATIALHALSFPSTEGFAPPSLSGYVGPTFYRLFPPAFRDLWGELEAARKDTNDRINRGIWAKIRSVVEQKIVTIHPSQFAIRAGPENKGTKYGPTFPSNIEVDSQYLMTDIRSRQRRPAYQEMLLHRNALPIAKYRDEIIATLERSRILVLCGETGCGKSTQVPAFILEDQLSRGKPCKIFCTEPRRISAISLAQRVSRELGDPPGAVGTPSSLVGYSIRLENRATRNTRLLYLTNGIALRMLEGSGSTAQGTAFDDVTHIIIDEVHERSIESDFLLIVLKSLIQSKPELRIILMSATVDSEKIANYFGGCQVLHVPGRTFPVDVCFLEDAIECTNWSISEDSPYAKRLQNKFYKNKDRTNWEEATVAPEEDDDDDDKTLREEDGAVTTAKSYSSRTETTIKLLDTRIIPYDLIVRLLEHLCFEDKALWAYSAATLIFMPGLAEIRRLSDLLSEHPSFGDEGHFRIYPLHSTISSDGQNAVFDVLSRGMRKIVIATNIAETGITIPDITCVIDGGKHREMMFDEKRQLSRLVETFIAKSNAAQRRGRAGRVQDGLCFHLFTRLRHDTLLAEHPLPEMMRLSLSDLALRIKTMKIKLGDSIEDVLSRALDPPAPVNTRRAVSALVEVKALTTTEEITPIGRMLSSLSSDVYLGKFLLMAVVLRCLDPALTIAAGLNSKSPFIKPPGLERDANRAKDAFKQDKSDFLTIHNAFSSWRRACANPEYIRTFCRKNFLSHENLLQIEELRQQFLGDLIDSSFVQADDKFVRELSRLRFGRNNPHRPRFVTVPPELNSYSHNFSVVNAALAAGLYPKLLSMDVGQMRTVSNNQLAFFHPSSVNFKKGTLDLVVNYLAYYTLMHSKRLYAWETTPVDDFAIILLCGDCDFKLISDSVTVDRKIKYRLTPKANVALKVLRKQMSSILAQKFHGRPLTESQSRWYELIITALGRVKQAPAEQDTAASLRFVR